MDVLGSGGGRMMVAGGGCGCVGVGGGGDTRDTLGKILAELVAAAHIYWYGGLTPMISCDAGGLSYVVQGVYHMWCRGSIICGAGGLSYSSWLLLIIIGMGD